MHSIQLMFLLYPILTTKELSNKQAKRLSRYILFSMWCSLCYFETRDGVMDMCMCPSVCLWLFYGKFLCMWPKMKFQSAHTLAEWWELDTGTLHIWRVQSDIGSGVWKKNIGSITIFCHLKKNLILVSVKRLFMFSSLKFANFMLEACIYRYCGRCLLSCWLYWGYCLIQLITSSTNLA